MAERQPKKMTVEEFFEWQQRQDRNYELVDGVPVLHAKASTGASARHDTITVNAILTLGNQLRGTPCRPRTSDQSIVTFRGMRRPDVSVECGKPEDQSMSASDPRVVIEVHSPSVSQYDLFHELEEYKRHALIEVILLFDSEAAQASVWRRHDAEWTYSERSVSKPSSRFQK